MGVIGHVGWVGRTDGYARATTPVTSAHVWMDLPRKSGGSFAHTVHVIPYWTGLMTASAEWRRAEL